MKKKEDVDKDKTPVPEEKMSTISRLESKYSDVLGRRRRKEQNETEDRDKTLEPDKMTFAPLQRSATTILGTSGAVAKKESTPYRLHRNYCDKNQPLSTRSYKPRSDLNKLQHSATSALAIPKTNYYESPTIRHKDSVYDIYGTRLPTSKRYNEFDHLNLNTKATYYDGREKENTFKSKYEPSRLYAELNNNETYNRDRNIPRYQKGYRRNATTNLSNYNEDLLNTPSTSSGYNDRNMMSSSHFCPDRSLGYHRSQTQKFFDSEKSSVLRSLNDNKKNEDEPIKSEAVKEREARRKEIQGLIAKYAQIDDIFLRATDNDIASDDKDSSRRSFNNENNTRTNGSAMDGRTTDLVNDSASTSLGLTLGLDPYSYAQTSTKTSFLPLSKTQSVSSMSSTNRTRIPKTLSTFVR